MCTTRTVQVGRIGTVVPRVQNFKQAALPSLDRDAALQLKSLVRLARQLGATDVDLARAVAPGGLAFSVMRGDQVLLRGNLVGAATQLSVN
jgi:hypothetical protein